MTINSIQGISGNVPMMRSMPRLTQDQKDQVASILSSYDPSNLTTTDAQEINSAFKDAGIGPGKDLRKAIESAGFDGEQLRNLAPPPPPPQGGAPPPSGQGPSSGQGVSGLNKDSLLNLQGILDNYDLENLSSEDENSLYDQLQSSNLLSPGLFVNVAV